MVDAGCRDLKEKILELCVGDIRVRILESPSVGGFAFALNMGIAESHGEYIARMDSDDISLPERFEEQVRYLDENKDVDVLGCRVRLIDSVSESLERSYPYFQSNRDIRRVLPFRNPLMHPALMFRKSVLLSVQGYKYGHTSEDHEMYIRMARNPKIGFYNLDKLLFEHRRHEMQGTGLGRIKASYVEISGFLFTEFLLTHSPKYLFGMFVIHPWVRRARMALRKWRYGRTH
jgi:glycosyltransferase involved in cell wall biosynthesis